MHKVRKATQVGPTCSSKWIKSRESLNPFRTLLNPHLPYSPRAFRWLVRTEVRLRAMSPPTTLFLALTPKFSSSPATATREPLSDRFSSSSSYCVRVRLLPLYFLLRFVFFVANSGSAISFHNSRNRLSFCFFFPF